MEPTFILFHYHNNMKRITLLFCCCSLLAAGQDSVSVRTTPLRDNLYFLDCINGEGGGNVAASIGDEGTLLVDDMYAVMSHKLEAAVRLVKDKPIRMILNTHFHGDHIEGNKSFRASTIIVGHDNVYRRLYGRGAGAGTDMTPAITFSDSLTIHFNGEEIKMIHFPNSHTDGDAIVYFTRGRVLHLGDMFFFEMFPAVYTEGGGDIRQLIVSLDKILARFPSDTQVIPGHGRIAPCMTCRT